MPAAIVTGFSRGLGRATALRFADDGYDVADPADFDRIMDGNVNSAFNATKGALSHLRDPGDAPSVTNVSSVLAHTGAGIECHHAASKGALVSLTRSHARDFAPGIRVNGGEDMR